MGQKIALDESCILYLERVRRRNRAAGEDSPWFARRENDESLADDKLEMAVRRGRVVLCRGLSEKNDNQEAYVRTLEQAGYVCSCLRTLRFEFVNIPELRECLLSPAHYLGLILTSQRAVETVGLAAKGNKDILGPWKDLPVYCVGPATESFAKAHLGVENCLGSEAGNAKELAMRIVDNIGTGSKPLLYPCSEIAKETIEQVLNEQQISVKKLVSYKTLASETLEQDLLEFLNNVPQIFVFFSPSTVEYIAAALKKTLSNSGIIKAVAIGPVTKQALLDAGLKVFAVASKPDPAALLQAIINAEEQGEIKLQ